MNSHSPGEKDSDNPSEVLTEDQRRAYSRQFNEGLHVPIKCVLHLAEDTISASVVNFNFTGACLKVAKGDTRALSPDVTLDLYLGSKCIREGMACRVCWQDIENTGQLGVQFTESVESHFKEYQRIHANELYPPTVVAQDALNPSRQIFFKVADFSSTGMSLITSATNNFLFPGMSLQNCLLTIPGKDAISIDFYIEAVKPGDASGTLFVSAMVKSHSLLFEKAIAEYGLAVSPSGSSNEDRFQHLVEAGQFHSNSLKAGLNYRMIENASDYEAVLKLRYLGYEKAGKVKPGTTWKEMGEGLQNEGKILGVFLGGQLLGSVEIRLGSQMPLRVSQHLTPEQMKTIEVEKTMEPSKLVVHPSAQGTDVVIGMLQVLHSMAVVQGELDVLLMATDQLSSFYSKMGAISLGIRIPHPILTNQTLNLMVFKRSLSAQGVGMNPFFWGQIWEATHTFLVDIGLATPIKKSIWHNLSFLGGKALWTLRRRWARSGSKKPRDERRTSSSGIDPKWTTQQLAASVMLGYILEAEEMIGTLQVATILSLLGVPRSYFFNQTSWVSMAFFDQFIEHFKKHGNVETLQRRAGKRSVQKEALGFNYYFLKHFSGIEALLQDLGRVSRRFNRTRTYEVMHMQPGRATLKIGYYDSHLLPKDPSACLNWIEIMEGLIELVTGKPGKVRKLACCLTGDPACVYELEWKKKRAFWSKLWDWSPLVLTIAVGLAALVSPQGTRFEYVLVGALFINGVYFTLLFHQKGLFNEFEKYHQESDERYADLQRSKSVLDQNYREAALLENLAKDVQKSDQLSHILNTTTSAICDRFGFGRSFIMLVDSDRKALRTAAVSGANEHDKLIWNFSVDVSQARDNPMVLSSVFLTSQPIVVEDVEAHKFHLNEASRTLVDKLETKGFALVPIPGAEENWGVIVADKGLTGANISRRDLVMLQRVAQHLGIALDKRARLEREEKLRLVFQKYVPSRIVSGFPDSDDPVLGGKNQNIVCMFIDIRGFTHLSENYPSELVLEILNKFFTLVQSVVAKHSGIIDKFLGDGVLVTWGTAASEGINCQDSLDASFEIIDQVEELSRELAASSLPSIEIGIGINAGMALVGNVGSADRMEYTAIGSTVNLASRLEGLCKVYDARIVISEAVLKQLAPEQLKRWRILEGVRIRGIDHTVSIGILED